MCNNWPDFPISVYEATGGLIGNTVMICGGHSENFDESQCYSLTSEKVSLVTHMSVGRMAAASVVLNDNTLWVTGGISSGGSTENQISTEYVTMSGTMPGPDLPKALVFHAMVAINSTSSMVIGGYHSQGISKLTFFYDHNGEEWINGPSLIQRRDRHAAGIVTDEVTNEQFLVVTGGSGYQYFDGFFSTFDSTEILQDGNWIQGKINRKYIFLKLSSPQIL